MRCLCSKALTDAADKTVVNDKANFKDTIDWMAEIRELEDRSVLDPPLSKDLYASVAPALRPTFNFAAYVNNSETLQQLIKLGVDLTKIERRRGLPEFVLKLDFEKDMKNHIQFLHQECGIPMESFGNVLTKNPLIFKESLLDLETRVNYLRSKLFKPMEIARIAELNPYWLMFRTPRIDRRLGYFQKKFDLLGPEVRTLSVKQPKLITFHLQLVNRNAFGVQEEFGFDKHETKMIILQTPSILMMDPDELLARLDYVHNVMKIPHERIVQQPFILCFRRHRIRHRHEFLQLLGRAQYDPTKDMYVSLNKLCVGSDEEFAMNVAKTGYMKFEAFLRQL